MGKFDRVQGKARIPGKTLKRARLSSHCSSHQVVSFGSGPHLPPCIKWGYKGRVRESGIHNLLKVPAVWESIGV